MLFMIIFFKLVKLGGAVVTLGDFVVWDWKILCSAQWDMQPRVTCG